MFIDAVERANVLCCVLRATKMATINIDKMFFTNKRTPQGTTVVVKRRFGIFIRLELPWGIWLELE